MLSVQPAHQPTHGSAVNPTDATALLRKEVDLAPATCQRPTSAGTGCQITEATGCTAAFVHHGTVAGIEQVESVRCEKANSALCCHCCVDLERNVNLPSAAAVSLEKLQLEACTYQDPALNGSDRGHALLGLPRPSDLPRH